MGMNTQTRKSYTLNCTSLEPNMTSLSTQRVVAQDNCGKVCKYRRFFVLHTVPHVPSSSWAGKQLYYYFFLYLFVCSFICLFVCLFIYLFTHSFIHLFIHTYAGGWTAAGRLPPPGQFCFESLQVACYQPGQHFLQHEVIMILIVIIISISIKIINRFPGHGELGTCRTGNMRWLQSIKALPLGRQRLTKFDLLCKSSQERLW